MRHSRRNFVYTNRCAGRAACPKLPLVTIHTKTCGALLLALATLAEAGPVHGAEPPRGPWTVSSTVHADRAPWPGNTLVLAWLGGNGGRLYPLPLLNRHGVILDQHSGRKVAATWSPKTGTAALLSLARGLTVAPAIESAHGWRSVEDPASGSRWLPGKPLAIEGSSQRQLDPIPETAVMPLRLAKRLAPEAQLPVSDAPPARLNSAWQDTRHRHLIPSFKQRLTVVLAREDAGAWRLGALPARGLVRATIGELSVMIVRAHGVTRAFMAPMADTVILAHDPWTGAPWLWTEGLGLWNGLTGRRLEDGQAATQALTAIELSEPAFRAHWPGGTVHDAPAKTEN